jgi:tRNA threonylcarbamoyl adenosine modification protein YeaZ
MSGALLAFELAGRACTVALATPQGSWQREFSEARGRALLAEIDALLREAGAARADLRGIVVGTGPGSYTGLRIACAAARALGWALGIPTAGLCSFEAAALDAPPGGEVHVLLDAFRGEIYHAVYERRADAVRVTLPPRLLRPEQIAAAVPPNARVIGDARFVAHPTVLIADSSAPSALALLRLARARGAGFDGAGVALLGAAEPLYLRPAAFRRPAEA